MTEPSDETVGCRPGPFSDDDPEPGGLAERHAQQVALAPIIDELAADDAQRAEEERWLGQQGWLFAEVGR